MKSTINASGRAQIIKLSLNPVVTIVLSQPYRCNLFLYLYVANAGGTLSRFRVKLICTLNNISTRISNEMKRYNIYNDNCFYHSVLRRWLKLFGIYICFWNIYFYYFVEIFFLLMGDGCQVLAVHLFLMWLYTPLKNPCVLDVSQYFLHRFEHILIILKCEHEFQKTWMFADSILWPFT